jgi:predicted peptidase
MADSVIIEYESNVSLPPGNPEDLFSFIDYGVDDLHEFYEARTSSERPIIAVYTNTVPELSANRTSVPGKYVILQLAEMNSSHWEAAWPQRTTDGSAPTITAAMQVPDSVAGFTVWRKVNTNIDVFRKDYSELQIIQKLNFSGENKTFTAGQIPEIHFEDVSWPYDADKFVRAKMGSHDNSYDLYYSYYLPDGYETSGGTYPLVVNLTGNGGRVDGSYTGTFEDMIGADVYRDTAAVGWLKADEDVIILSPQLWRNKSGINVTQDTIKIVNYFKNNYRVDPKRVYCIGSSAGTMTLSSVMQTDAELFTAYLMSNGIFTGVQSIFTTAGATTYGYNRIFDGTWNAGRWSAMLGDTSIYKNKSEWITAAHTALDDVVNNRLPIRIFHGYNDESFNPTQSYSAYYQLRELYKDDGLSEAEINELVQMTIWDNDKYWDAGICEIHMTSKLVAADKGNIQWALSKVKP